MASYAKIFIKTKHSCCPAQILFTGSLHTFLAAMRRIALGLMEGNSLTTEVMSALNDQLTYIFSCLKRRYIQPLLLFQSSPGVRPKLVCLLNSFPALSCSLTSVSPVFLFLFASFCVSFSMFSLNVLDYPLIFKREPLKY